MSNTPRSRFENVIFNRRWYCAILFGLAITASEAVLDYSLRSRYRNFWLLYCLHGAVITVVAIKLGNARRERMRQRLQELAYLNHHIRNAIQVMLNAHCITDGQKRLEMLQDSANRVRDALQHMSKEEIGKLEPLTEVPLVKAASEDKG